MQNEAGELKNEMIKAQRCTSTWTHIPCNNASQRVMACTDDAQNAMSGMKRSMSWMLPVKSPFFPKP